MTDETLQRMADEIETLHRLYKQIDAEDRVSVGVTRVAVGTAHDTLVWAHPDFDDREDTFYGDTDDDYVETPTAAYREQYQGFLEERGYDPTELPEVETDD